MVAIAFPTAPAANELYQAPNGFTYAFDAIDSKWRVLKRSPIERVGIFDLDAVTDYIFGEARIGLVSVPACIYEFDIALAFTDAAAHPYMQVATDGSNINFDAGNSDYIRHGYGRTVSDSNVGSGSDATDRISMIYNSANGVSTSFDYHASMWTSDLNIPLVTPAGVEAGRSFTFRTVNNGEWYDHMSRRADSVNPVSAIKMGVVAGTMSGRVVVRRYNQ